MHLSYHHIPSKRKALLELLQNRVYEIWLEDYAKARQAQRSFYAYLEDLYTRCSLPSGQLLLDTLIHVTEDGILTARLPAYYASAKGKAMRAELLRWLPPAGKALPIIRAKRAALSAWKHKPKNPFPPEEEERLKQLAKENRKRTERWLKGGRWND